MAARRDERTDDCGQSQRARGPVDTGHTYNDLRVPGLGAGVVVGCYAGQGGVACLCNRCVVASAPFLCSGDTEAGKMVFPIRLPT